MLEQLKFAHIILDKMNEEIEGDSKSSPHEKEMWNTIPYVSKLNAALEMIDGSSDGLVMKSVRGVIGVGALASLVGRSDRARNQMTQELRIVSTMIGK